MRGHTGMKTQDRFRTQLSSKLRQNGESGASLVEAAVSLLLLFMFILGIMEVSLALYSYHFVSDAAREGTRYAIVRGSDWTAQCDGTGNPGTGYSSSGCIANAADVEKYVSSLNFPGIGITTSDVCVQFLTSLPSSPSSSCTATSSTTEVPAAGNIVQVTVTYPFNFGLPGYTSGHKYAYTLASTSQVVIAQ
jgi:Flp pilus assembly protein TadG